MPGYLHPCPCASRPSLASELSQKRRSTIDASSDASCRGRQGFFALQLAVSGPELKSDRGIIRRGRPTGTQPECPEALGRVGRAEWPEGQRFLAVGTTSGSGRLTGQTGQGDRRAGGGGGIRAERATSRGSQPEQPEQPEQAGVSWSRSRSRSRSRCLPKDAVGHVEFGWETPVPESQRAGAGPA